MKASDCPVFLYRSGLAMSLIAQGTVESRMEGEVR